MIEADGDKVQPGLRANLIVEAYHDWGDGRAMSLDVSPSGMLLAVWATVAPAQGEQVRIRMGPTNQSPSSLCDIGLARVAHVRLTRPMQIGLDLVGEDVGVRGERT